MATTINTRIQLKNDTEANWEKAIHFIPLKGELIIYSADDAHPFFRIKAGDGVTVVKDLPFINANSSDLPNTKGGTGAITVIDAQTNLGIVYSETEPVSPFVGMIWLKPLN